MNKIPKEFTLFWPDKEEDIENRLYRPDIINVRGMFESSYVLKTSTSAKKNCISAIRYGYSESDVTEYKFDNSGFKVTIVGATYSETNIVIEGPSLDSLPYKKLYLSVSTSEIMDLITKCIVDCGVLPGTYCLEKCGYSGNELRIRLENPRDIEYLTEKDLGSKQLSERRTTKWIPGHRYLLKNGNVYFYLGDVEKLSGNETKQTLYLDNNFYGLGYTPRVMEKVSICIEDAFNSIRSKEYLYSNLLNYELVYGYENSMLSLKKKVSAIDLGEKFPIDTKDLSIFISRINFDRAKDSKLDMCYRSIALSGITKDGLMTLIPESDLKEIISELVSINIKDCKGRTLGRKIAFTLDKSVSAEVVLNNADTYQLPMLEWIKKDLLVHFDTSEQLDIINKALKKL